MTLLDRLARGSFSLTRQWEARLSICRHVHQQGLHPGPAFRIGSNAPGATLEPDDLETIEPCPRCGAPGGDILGADIGGVGGEYCQACGEEWICGDYDWRSLADCLRFRADLAAGHIAWCREIAA